MCTRQNRLWIALLTLSQRITPLPPSACVPPVVHQVVIGEVSDVGEINVDCGRRINMVADSRLELQDGDAVSIYAGGVRCVAFGSPGRPRRGTSGLTNIT